MDHPYISFISPAFSACRQDIISGKIWYIKDTLLPFNKQKGFVVFVRFKMPSAGACLQSGKKHFIPA